MMNFMGRLYTQKQVKKSTVLRQQECQWQSNGTDKVHSLWAHMDRALGIHYQFMHRMYGTVEMNEFSVFAPKNDWGTNTNSFNKFSIVMGVKSKVSHYHNLYERTDLGPMNKKKCT